MVKLLPDVSATDSTLFGSIRVIFLGSFFIVFILSLFLPDYAAWVVKRTFDLFYVIIHVVGGLLIGLIWLILKFIEIFNIELGADTGRAIASENLGELLQVIANITYGMVDGTFEFVSQINPIDDGINAPPAPEDDFVCFATYCPGL